MSIQQMFMVPQARLASATGGTITYYQNWQIHTFTSSGTFRFIDYNLTAPPVKFILVDGGFTGGSGDSRTDNEDGGNGGNGGTGGLYRFSVSEYTAASFGLTSRTVTVGGAGSPSAIQGFPGAATSSGSSGSGGLGGAQDGPG